MHARTCFKRIAMLAVLSLSGCDGSSGPEVRDDPSPQPGSTNTVLPLFSRPFTGDFPVLNYFDHDLPNSGLSGVQSSGGYQLTWRGERVIPGIHIGGYDGHTGIDWVMPVGTPMLAVADGLVVAAGESAPGYCGLQDEITTQISVVVGHRAANGETYTVLYTHLSRADVLVNQRVVRGQQIGLSGATGCVGRDGVPHLHFEIRRVTNTNNGSAALADPYGWEGAGVDPWAQHPQGATSMWLWQPGEAPSLVR